MRECYKCKREKDVSEFGRSKARKDGISKTCKSCNRACAKRSATQELKYEIDQGNITRPENCSVCDKVCKVHGHHPDYDKPLDVVWLCPKCHKQEHKRIGNPPESDINLKPKVIRARVTLEYYDRFEQFFKDNKGLDRSCIIRNAIVDFMDRHEKECKFRRDFEYRTRAKYLNIPQNGFWQWVIKNNYTEEEDATTQLASGETTHAKEFMKKMEAGK